MRSLALSAMLVVGIGFATIAPASAATAQVDPVSCGSFETQGDAQAALNENPDLAETLDNDGNGIACEDLLPDDAVVDPVSCGFFETREDAQDALDEDPDLATTLDSDGNGIACETLPKGTDGGTTPTGAAGTTTALPNTGAGSIAHDSTLFWILPVAALAFAVGGMLSLSGQWRQMSDTRI